VASWALGCAGSACQGANLLGCVNLARSYRDGIGGPADPARAIELFTAVCENTLDNAVPAASQQVKACALLGGMHLAGTAPASSAARGRALSEQACDGGDDFGCFNAATAHAAGLGGPVDEGRAAAYFDGGCTAGDAESCYELSLRLHDGRGVPRDATRARTLRAQACAAGFRKACGSSAAPR
jgi:TPR repeat protein